MPIFKLATVLTFALAASAFAAEPTPAPGPAVQLPENPAAAKPALTPKEKLVCTTEQPTGSRVAKRVCRTVAQIEEERANARNLRDTSRASVLPERGGFGAGKPSL